MDSPTLQKVHRSKALFCEGSSRGCLQVTLKLNGTLAFGEGNGSFNPPRPEFDCMRNLAGVVCFQTVLQIFSETHIKMFRLQCALQDIDVEEFHGHFPISQLACRVVARSAWLVVGLKPAYALRASAFVSLRRDRPARQSSLYVLERLACRAVARMTVVEPARLRASRYGAAAFVLASLQAKAGARCRV